MEKVFMKLHQAIEEITGLKKSKVSYTDIAQALGVSRQYANQIKEKDRVITYTTPADIK